LIGAAERPRADLTVDKRSQDYGRFFIIEAYRSEHETMLASKHFETKSVEEAGLFLFEHGGFARWISTVLCLAVLL